jgi:hypothetical protein
MSRKSVMKSARKTHQKPHKHFERKSNKTEMDEISIGQLDNDSEILATDALGDYVRALNLSSTNTYHAYESSLPFELHHHLLELKYGKIMETLYFKNLVNSDKYTVETIQGMNELYVASLGAQGSDRVFETDHLDGPFYFLPWCKVYRVVLGITPNTFVHTRFPIQNIHTRIDKYCFAAFDYNRDIHSVYASGEIVPEQRAVMKFHYIYFPKFLPRFMITYYKWIHTFYNSMMRNVFLVAQLPKQNNQQKLIPWMMSSIINRGTIWYCNLIHLLNRKKEKARMTDAKQ